MTFFALFALAAAEVDLYAQWPKWTEQSTSLTLASYTAGERGFHATSYVLVGNTEIVIIDAQAHSDDAEHVIEIAKRFNKPVVAILISRSNPDQYAGTAFLLKAFPDAEVFSSRDVAVDIATHGKDDLTRRRRFWIDAPVAPPVVATLPGHTLRMAGLTLRLVPLTLGPNDHALAFYESTLHLLFASGAVFNGVHPPLKRTKPPAYLAAIDELAAWKPAERVLCGYGNASDGSVFVEEKRYLQQAAPFGSVDAAKPALSRTFSAFLRPPLWD